MAAFFLLPAKVDELVSGMLATLAFHPGLQVITPTITAAVGPACGGPVPVVAAMLRSNVSERPPRAMTAMSGRAIQRAPDGLFYIDANVNGASVRFLIDTGATTIVLTKADAARAGVLPNSASFDETANTAGGETAMARVRLARLAVGQAIDFDVPAAVAGNRLGVSLLGASWLTQIGSMTITGDRMVLQ